MQKALALLSQEPALQEIANKLDELHKHQHQRVDFLQKQYNDMEKEFDFKLNQYLKEALDYLKSKKLIGDDFDVTKQHLHINTEVGAVMLCDANHKVPPIIATLEGFFNR